MYTGSKPQTEARCIGWLVSWLVGWLVCRFVGNSGYYRCLLSMTDEDLSQNYSTSPHAESADFVPHARRWVGSKWSDKRLACVGVSFIMYDICRNLIMDLLAFFLLPFFLCPSYQRIFLLLMQYQTRCTSLNSHMTLLLVMDSHRLLSLLARAPKPAKIFPNNNPLFFTRKVTWQQTNHDRSHTGGKQEGYLGHGDLHLAKKAKEDFTKDMTLGTSSGNSDVDAECAWVQIVAERRGMEGEMEGRNDHSWPQNVAWWVDLHQWCITTLFRIVILEFTLQCETMCTSCLVHLWSHVGCKSFTCRLSSAWH